MQSKQADGNSNGQLKEIGRTNKRGWCSGGKGYAPEICPAVSDKEDAVALYQQRYGNQDNDHRLIDDGLRLKTEEKNNGGE